MKKVLIIGPAYPLRGGLATFDHRLCQQFLNERNDCSIISYSLQYPSLLFPGKTQYSTDPAPNDIKIYSWINSINPANWIEIGRRIAKLKPELIVVRYWIPFMGPALGTILRQIKKNRYTKIICIADNVLPHEKRPGDKAFTNYFLRACDGFITMSEKVLNDLRKFDSTKPVELVQHPLYDNFGNSVNESDAREKLGLDKNDRIVLFFGFIRKYKGLDLLLKAMADVKLITIKLMIAGEFYEDEKPYLDLIKELNIEDRIILKTQFIPDSEVKYYLCAANCVVQPYRNATQSGVTPLAYHFEKPMIVTNVGSLPDLVPNGKAGIVCEPDPSSIANAIERFFELGEDYFIPHLRSEKQKYTWDRLTSAITELEKQV
jgi:glycosyltransferase involved in cell wall biosynthesis